MGKTEPFAGKKKDDAVDAPGRPQLRLVKTCDVDELAPAVERERRVRSARRSLGRLLRALPAANWNASAFPDAIVTRLAHCDSVTAAYLCDCELLDVEEVDAALLSLCSIERWVRDGLDAASRGAVRCRELQVCILDEELSAPLVLSEWNDAFAKVQSQEDPALCDLAQALDRLPLTRLLTIGQRLGGLPAGYQQMPPDLLRISVERTVLQTLRDPAMLSVLVATLPDNTRCLIAQILREPCDETCHRRWAQLYRAELPCACVGSALTYDDRASSQMWHPVQVLRDCGLVFLDPSCRLWIPSALTGALRAVLVTLGQLELTASRGAPA